MPLIFITGGVRSGKSAFAEQLVLKQGELNGGRLVYLATGVATDDEMQKRIQRHQHDRHVSEKRWHTIEAPYDIVGALASFHFRDIVLWDCVTTWLTNCFYEGFDRGQPCIEQKGCVERKIALMKEAVMGALQKNVMLVVVSNEVLDEPAAPFEEVVQYRKYLGELHQWFVALASEVYELDYSIAKKWK